MRGFDVGTRTTRCDVCFVSPLAELLGRRWRRASDRISSVSTSWASASEQSHPRRPFTVRAFEIRSLSHSCSTPFKYFKWVRCGAITRLQDHHQFIHQAADGHISASSYLLSFRCRTEDVGCWPSSKPPGTSGTATDRRHYSSFLLPNNSRRN